MKEREKKEEGALLCPLSLERVRGSFYASVARLEGIFSPSPVRSDREERIPPAPAPATATIKFSFRREAIKTEKKGDLGNYAL